MNRSCLTILLLVAFVLPVHAFIIGSGNDGWTLGLTGNNVDLLTGSVHIVQELDDFTFSADDMIFTQRPSKERCDILDFSAVWTKIFSLPGEHALSVGTGAGISLIGNLAGQQIQNAVHMVMAKDNLDFTAPDKLRLFPLADIRIGLSRPATTQVFLGVGARFFADAGTILIESGCGVKASYRGTGASLGLSYVKAWNNLGFQNYADMVSGPAVSFGLDVGGIGFSYKANLSSGTSYMIISANLDSMASPTWKRSLGGFRFSKMYLSSGDVFERMDFRHSFRDYLDFGFKWAWSDGYNYSRNANTETYRTRVNYAIWEIFASVCLKREMIEPYFSLTAGLGEFRVDELTPNGDVFAERNRAYQVIPSLSVETGARMLPEGLLVTDSSTVRLDLYAGLSFLPGAWKALRSDMSHKNGNGLFFWYAGAGADFSF